MPCFYCAETHPLSDQVYRLEAKDGKLLGHASYRCLLGTHHPEWWIQGKILVPSRMPYRCTLLS